ncbi:SMC-Scp complex subunit ScpB [Aporhodopirellula aestuarii]|uniref:SMC-Scp complex subunit ScpB n=1 Tax=Aporhodopirellula aestuarii TaxID=2950107 RepID=A0ABT0U318_9BACT|nr:SMC-Scp complex subunit ScpB [Aporhodopirellula aestuarii]MCM2370883.1 SMC-Scp complex subunit ScpB [Aporhodopirellula aestuarii]
MTQPDNQDVPNENSDPDSGHLDESERTEEGSARTDDSARLEETEPETSELAEENHQGDDFDDEPENEFDDDEDAFSLEELGAAYKHIVARSDSEDGGDAIEIGEVLQREHLIAAQANEPNETESDEAENVDQQSAPVPSEGDEEPESTATPEAIIEAALFVGNPNSNGITAARLASIMRGMTPEEVVEIIDSLNASYKAHRQGIRIAQDESGYRIVVAPEVESMRHVFTGKVRETRLSQGAIEVLSLVAYQPGITAPQCTDKRGRDSGPLLNQMVRRRLIEMRREPEVAPETSKTATASDEAETPEAAPKAGKKPPKPKLVSKFYPAERLLVLLGLESLEDLPQVEEVHLE